ncbi:MAG: MlaD family protein [Spirochaetaceae bacterium]|jgi:phospholipid/cholesterol/gamma-HCH transport system substrate-binding protein|nr:MlaD family protein [Spirochaetaceae bacterium]
MKFRIRYADQIVGILIIVALLSLILVVVFLGKAQRWFSKNYNFKSYAATASGLSQNMNVTFRGIPIGNVKSFRLLDNNQIEVLFTIQDLYRNRVKEGSLVEVVESPIGLGARFVFYSGLGSELAEGKLVPMVNSPEGRLLIGQGLTNIPPKDDKIADIMEKVPTLLGELQKTLEEVRVAAGGAPDTALGQTIVNLGKITANLEELSSNLKDDLGNPNGIRKILNGDGDSVNALEASFVSLAGTLDNAEKSLDHVEKSLKNLPQQMPEIFSLVANARTAMSAANDVLISLRNNPLLKNGIPEHAQIDSSGTNPRNISF